MANLKKSRLKELKEPVYEGGAGKTPLVAIYARVSTNKQAKEDTIERQLAVTKERYERLFGTHESARLVDVFKDEGYNLEAKDSDREFWKLIELVKAKQVNTIIVAASDRIFRGESAELRGEITDVFRHLSVRLISQSEDVVYRVTDTSGRIASAVIQELGAIAKLENSRMLQSGRIQKLVNQDQWRLTNVPFGYRFEKTGKKENPWRYFVVEKEAQVVSDIFRLYCGAGAQTLSNVYGNRPLSVYDIADQLNSAGVDRSPWVAVTPSAKPGPWNRYHVLAILRNEIYAGRLIVSFKPQARYNISLTTKVIEVPRIVDEELFEKARVRYQDYHDRITSKRRPRDHKRWLHGLLQCSECKGRMVTRGHGRTHPVYVCSEQPSHRTFRVEDVERLAAREISTLSANDSLIDAVIARLKNGDAAEAEAQQASLAAEAARDSLEKKRDLLTKVTEKWAAGLLADDTYLRVRDKNLSVISDLEEQLAKADAVATGARLRSKPADASHLTIAMIRAALTAALGDEGDSGDRGERHRSLREALQLVATHAVIVPDGSGKEGASGQDLIKLSDIEIRERLADGRLTRRGVAEALGISLTTAKRRWPGKFGMRAKARAVDFRVEIVYR